MALLLIDNNDSFTYNLHHQIIRLTGIETSVIFYDAMKDHNLSQYDGYIISPGPGHPSEYPDYSILFKLEKPIFGVCLGMQLINSYYDGEVSRLSECRHGVTLNIEYMDDIEEVAVYNSLYCNKVADGLEVIANYKNIPMALRHKQLPYAGVQFHSESFMTPNGDKILNDMLNSIGIV
ncbi:MAG: type 1 glutamine amidotransferase [Denitrovibrio sp.]|nr:MAG: type 1 glutamine amidotransferase [Denitrovibrio sp.]